MGRRGRAVKGGARDDAAVALARGNGFVSVLLQGMGLEPEALLDHFVLVDPARLAVLDVARNKCYSFARMRAEAEPAGFYCEGFVLMPTGAGAAFPVGHAWFERADGGVEDGTHVDAAWQRIGVRVPAAAFRAALADPAFEPAFTLHQTMPFHWACHHTGRATPWLEEGGAAPAAPPPAAPASAPASAPVSAVPAPKPMTATGGPAARTRSRAGTKKARRRRLR